MHVADFGLHFANLAHDVIGRQRGLFRQAANLPGDNCETTPGLAGTRRLDRGIQRQQIGLAGDAADEIDDAVDLLRALGKGIDLARGQAEAVLHLGGLALQLAEMLLVAQRRGGDLAGTGLVIAQLPGEEVERLAEMGHGGAEANQPFRHTPVIVELSLALLAGSLCRLQLLLQRSDASRLFGVTDLQRIQLLLQARRAVLPLEPHALHLS